MMTKAELVRSIANDTNLNTAQVKAVLDSLVANATRELKSGEDFAVPDMLKIRVHRRPATKARMGTNPITREPMKIQAKPATNVLKVRVASSFAGAATPKR
mgnify:CR=1 FL=1